MKKLLTILFLFIGACHPVPDPVMPVTDATCSQVCNRGRELDCEFSKDTPAGSRCEDVCQNVMDSGIVTWDLDCMASSGSCEELNRCGR